MNYTHNNAVRDISKLIDYLSEYVTDHKKQRIDEVLAYRTRHLTVVLEDIYQPQNASAIVRTCDIFGVQDLHIVENTNYYELNPEVVKGSSKWITMHRHNSLKNNTPACMEQLKEKGYRILATSPHANSLCIDDVSIDEKTAIVFGTEHTGVSSDMMSYADDTVKIPMHGFTESFNVSVCAAICLHRMVEKLHKSEIDWRLTLEEKEQIRLDWYRHIVVNSALLEKRFLEQQPK